MKTIQTRFCLFYLLFAASFWSSTLMADAADGWGLAMGGGSFKPSGYSDDQDFEASGTYGYALDYQWALGKTFYITLGASEHGGKGVQATKPDYKYYKVGYFGMELRAWLGSMFVGYHSGSYYLTWIASSSEYSNITQSSGSGYGAGFETDSGWILAAYKEQGDHFTFDELPDQKTDGYRIILGYRFR